MENLSERIYWEIYRSFHNTICSETYSGIEFKLRKKLEESLCEDIEVKCRWQLCGEINFQLEKKIKNEEYK
jgi:hypothetical protein